MANKKDQDLDQETKEILEEMEADGYDTSDISGDTDVDKALEDPEEKESESEEEEESEQSEEDEESEDDDASDDEESEDEESDDEPEEDESKDKKIGIVSKYRRERKLRKAAEATIVELQKTKSDESFDKELESFATESHMPLDVAKKFIELAAKRSGLSPDLMASLQQSQKDKRNSDYWANQRKQFGKDFKDNVIPVLESLGKSKDDIDAIYKTINEDKKSPLYAWSPKNKSVSLVKLALTIARNKNSRTSSEGNAGKSMNRGKSGKAPEEMSGEDIDNMSDEEFDTMSDNLAKNTKSTIHRA